MTNSRIPSSSPSGTPSDTPSDTADGRDLLWRQLCQAEYDIVVREYGNDGHPDDDLSTTEQRARAHQVASRLSREVQIPEQTLRDRASEAAEAHGRDPGTDSDPDRFAPPDWAQAHSAGWPQRWPPRRALPPRPDAGLQQGRFEQRR